MLLLVTVVALTYYVTLYGDLILIGAQVFTHHKIHSNHRSSHHKANITSIIINDVSSSEFKRIAASTYEKILPCILDTWMMKDRKQSASEFKFPEDAQYHYELIKNITNSYTYAPVHEYAVYEGPF